MTDSRVVESYVEVMHEVYIPPPLRNQVLEAYVEVLHFGTPPTIESTTASESYSSEPPSNAVDGLSATNWTTNGSALPQWWSALFSLAAAVTAYAIRARDDILTRNINAWLFQGAYFTPDIPLGSITTASSQYDSGSYAATQATDGLWYTRWASASVAPQWLRVQLPTAMLYTEYALGGFVGETGSPKDWTFEGSNDGSTWTTLDTQTGVTTWAANTLKVYSFTNSTAYLYYRINVSANEDSSYVRLSRVRLGPEPAAPSWTTLDSQSGVTWLAGQTKIYSFANTTAYDMYRVYITANNGDSYTSISDILLMNTPNAIAAQGAQGAQGAQRRAIIVASRAAQRASRW